MSLLLVTALYDLYQGMGFESSPPTSSWSESWLSLDFRIKQIQDLAECNVDMVVFVDPKIEPLLPKFYDGCTIIPYPLDKVRTYSSVIRQSDVLALPAMRNETKDTLEYLALMNSKLDFVELAMELRDGFTHYAWVDAGIFKHIHDKGAGKNMINGWKSIDFPNSIVTPCGLFPPLPSDVCFPIDSVYWRFLGSVLVIPSEMVPIFSSRCHNAMWCIMQEAGTITWEINTWAYLESRNPDMFSPYLADHDGSIVNIPTNQWRS